MILSKVRNRLLLAIEKFKPKRNVKIHRGCSVAYSMFEGHNTVNRNCIIYKSAVGTGTYFGNGSRISCARIGRYCSIADNVRIVRGNHPTSIFVTTHPSFYYDTETQYGFTFHKGMPIFNDMNRFPNGEKEYNVVIGNDVWIGCNCLILEGVKIGDGAIIGAGAVVTKDVPSYSVVVGVPAKVIKYRFTEDQISILEKLKWWDWPYEKIKKHYLSFSNISDFIDEFIGDCEG